MEDLISKEYLAALREKNDVKPWSGTRGVYAEEVAKRVRPMDEVLDFGCAHQALGRRLKDISPVNRVHGYDPAQPELATWPEGKFHIIVATDVMEHVEPQYLEPTLRRFNQCCTRAMFFVIATTATGKKLPNGWDHHLIVESQQWWLDRFARVLPFWQVEVIWTKPKEFACWLTLR